MIGPHGVPVEVHLQTEEMEQVAEMGVTAHWVYKEGGKNDSTTAQVRAQRWLQSLVDIQQNVGNSFEFIENVKSEFFPKKSMFLHRKVVSLNYQWAQQLSILLMQCILMWEIIVLRQ